MVKVESSLEREREAFHSPAFVFISKVLSSVFVSRMSLARSFHHLVGVLRFSCGDTDRARTVPYPGCIDGQTLRDRQNITRAQSHMFMSAKATLEKNMTE
jgi:hypothetical protein